MFHLSHAIRTYTCWPEPHCLFALYQPVISAMIVVKRNGIVVICLWGEDGNVRMNIKCDTFLNMTIDQLYFWYPTLRRSLSLSIAIFLQSPFLYHCSCTEVQSNDIISQQHTNNNSIIAEDFYEITNNEYVARSAPNRKFVPRNEKHLFSYHIITRACNHIL